MLKQRDCDDEPIDLIMVSVYRQGAFKVQTQDGDWEGSEIFDQK